MNLQSPLWKGNSNCTVVTVFHVVICISSYNLWASSWHGHWDGIWWMRWNVLNLYSSNCKQIQTCYTMLGNIRAVIYVILKPLRKRKLFYSVLNSNSRNISLKWSSLHPDGNHKFICYGHFCLGQSGAQTVVLHDELSCSCTHLHSSLLLPLCSAELTDA